jgi:flagella basal body P-ring formation protein FlgA
MMSLSMVRSLRFPLACALVLLPALAAGGAQAAPASAPVLALTLRHDVQLDHARILLGDVAALPAGTAPDVAGLDLGAAPRVNAVERLTRAQIALLIRRRLQWPAAALAWSGADSVSVQRHSQPVAGAVLGEAAVDAVLAAWSPRFPGLQASVEAPPADVEIVRGAYTITARALDATRLPARAAVWLDLLVDGQVQRSVVVPVSFTWQRPAYVARRALAAGSTVQAEDFDVREQNVAGLDAQPVGGTPAPGWRLRRAMQPGQVLARGLLPASGTVFPGDTVLVQVHSGAIGIDMPAVVQTEAAQGQQVVVRTQHSSETLTGRLTAAGTVLIE